MIRRRRAQLLTLAFALASLSAPAPASASHELPEGEAPLPVDCSPYSGEPTTRSDKLSRTIFIGCDGGDPGHITTEVRQPDGVTPRGIVSRVEDGGSENGGAEYIYTALRPGRDVFIVRVADGTTQDEATLTVINDFPEGLGLARPGDAQPNRKGIVAIGAGFCQNFPFPGAGSCTVEGTARATIRPRGKPRRTVTIGKASLTLKPDQSRRLKVKLSAKFLRVLKQARLIRVAVSLKTKQSDPFGLWKAERKVRFTLYSR